MRALDTLAKAVSAAAILGGVGWLLMAVGREGAERRCLNLDDPRPGSPTFVRC